jgi:hypothetical protein
MASPSLVLSQTDMRGDPVWLEVIADLQIARRRLRQLASVISGEYLALDQRIHQIVTSLVRLASDTHW